MLSKTLMLAIALSGILLYFTLYCLTFNKVKSFKLVALNLNLKMENNISVSQSETENVIPTIANDNFKTKSLLEVLSSFPWDSFNYSERPFNNNNKTFLISGELIEKLLTELLPFVIMEPKVRINSSCSSPPPPIQLLVGDSGKMSVYCKRRNMSRKIGVILQFGFDVDSLEIHFNELYDLVNQFFIIESTKSHFRAMKKPLIWERIKDQDRFSRFRDKVIHFVLDDSDTAFIQRGQDEILKNTINNSIETDWRMERLQESERWRKFLNWNSANNFFNDDDFIGFGDSDEVPSRNNINYLKNCEVEVDPVDIGIWFPYGNINNALETEQPITRFPYSLGDPTYWRLITAKNYSLNYPDRYPSRNRGKSPEEVLGKKYNLFSGQLLVHRVSPKVKAEPIGKLIKNSGRLNGFILGGMHMSKYGYLPLVIVKKLTETEADAENIRELINSLKYVSTYEDLEDVKRKSQEFPSRLKGRVRLLSTIMANTKHEESMKEIAVLPWFYNCNRGRYPSWEGGRDTRIY